ncbi:MAG: tRNA (adenosine(37)-N6)-threonylcarbamoyltransferase complex transferase subunit TsaD [Ruminococcaceae bacterium]|nr:tRNA (adenosine(37)-N6)-threonylcarbamoyltransferase complex transferase subunit TsaD [Oscillospiraceae bacterium]
MYIFAIESSCDDTAAAVIHVDMCHRINVLSSIVSSQIETHALYGGVVPEIASRAHCEAISHVAREAIQTAGITLSDIGAVAVTFAPGLIGSLLVGVSFAKSLAAVLDVPLIPVNHIEAHVAASYAENPNLEPPYLALVVSGGHTSLYDVSDHITFTEIGGTTDDAAGEAFDKVGRVMGMPYPGGAAMDKLAAVGFLTWDPSKKDALHFPSPAKNDDSLNLSFSGIKTAAINHIHTTRQRLKLEDDAPLPDEIRAEIAAAFTHAVCTGIAKKLDLALKGHKYTSLVMAGGVAANSHLRRHVSEVCEGNGVEFVVPSPKLCGDNAVMTAAQGYHMVRYGLTADSTLNAFASDEGAEEYLTALKKLWR